MSRRKGRILAFQALYSYDVGNVNRESLMNFDWVEQKTLKKIGEDGKIFAQLLVSGTIEHLDEIDEKIKANIEKWDFERINKVDLALLRMSVYSLMYQKDMHPSIVIDEAIDISKEFGVDDAYKFINAVLDSIRKSLL
ncbi:MAG: transcription antitermination factor NusB [Treponema sp.]|nr:transcription antitermination factor NusB [Treponema sp.]